MEKKVIEITAAQLEKAQQEALVYFNLKSVDLLDCEILDEGKRTFLGLGSKKTTYKFTVKPDYAELVKPILSDYLVLANLEVSLETSYEKPFLRVVLTGEDEALFMANNGELLQSIEHYLKKYLSRLLELDKSLSIQCSCGTLKNNKEERLKELARKVKERVLKAKRGITLNPMPPSDRRIIHQFLSQDTMVSTRSLGDGFYKKMRIDFVKPGKSRFIEDQEGNKIPTLTNAEGEDIEYGNSIDYHNQMAKVEKAKDQSSYLTGRTPRNKSQGGFSGNAQGSPRKFNQEGNAANSGKSNGPRGNGKNFQKKPFGQRQKPRPDYDAKNGNLPAEGKFGFADKADIPGIIPLKALDTPSETPVNSAAVAELGQDQETKE